MHVSECFRDVGGGEGYAPLYMMSPRCGSVRCFVAPHRSQGTRDVAWQKAEESEGILRNHGALICLGAKGGALGPNGTGRDRLPTPSGSNVPRSRYLANMDHLIKKSSLLILDIAPQPNPRPFIPKSQLPCITKLGVSHSSSPILIAIYIGEFRRAETTQWPCHVYSRGLSFRKGDRGLRSSRAE